MKVYGKLIRYGMTAFLGLTAILPHLLWADKSVDVSGIWLGTLGEGNDSIRIVFKISGNSNDGIKTEFMGPDQGWDDGPCAGTISYGDELRIQGLQDYPFLYQGRLSENGLEIKGNWIFRGSLPLDLKKVGGIPPRKTFFTPKHLKDFKPWIDRQILPVIQSGAFSGSVVGLVHKDETIVFRYGHNTFRGNQTPDGNTEFPIGSISKMFTELLLADRVNKREMSLDDPVQKYLPGDAKVPSKGGRQITLLELNNHTSGLPSDPDDMVATQSVDPQSLYTVPQLYQYLSRCQLLSVPGEKENYSTLGVGLLCQAIALEAGSTYEKCLQGEILGPVGMKDTGVSWVSDELARAAQGYNGYGQPNPQDQWKDAFAGGGGLHSTVNDMLKFARAAMGPDSPISGIFSDPAGDSLAIKKGIKHGGQTIGGFTSMITINRVDQTAMVVWFNSGFPETRIYNNLFLLAHGIKPYPVVLPHFIRLPEGDLKPYEGSYLEERPNSNGKLPDIVKLFVKNGHLYAGSDSLEFYPEAGGNFFEKLQHTDVIFHRDEQGRVMGFSAFWKIFKRK